MNNLHNSFYGFYPSDIFDFGEQINEIRKKEENIKSISDLFELKKLYKEAMPRSIGKDAIIKKCEYSKEILRISLSDIENFSNNSQRTASELVSLMSLFVAVMALVTTKFGIETLVIFGVMAIIGTCRSYVNAVKLRTSNSAVIEKYRNMTMCFETVIDMAREMTMK